MKINKKGDIMIKKIKNHNITELLIIFTITLLFNLICNTLVHDEVWNYGFSYNIATGLIPYKDFNMVITPLYPILGAIFMLLIGKSFFVYHILNAIICTMIFYYIKKTNHKSYYISYSILLFISMPGYNLFCLLLIYIIMNLEEKNTNDYIIGILLGLTFLTKQNIGIFLCLPTLSLKNKKRILKRICGFIVPNTLLLIYLLINNTLYEFIDYVFLGIFSFSKDNLLVIPIFIIISLISILYLIYKYIKTKDIKLLYIICFQGMAYPIFDLYHTIIPFIPTITYFLKDLKLNKKIIKYAFCLFIISIFSYNIHNYTSKKYTYPNNTNVYKYKKINNNVVTSLNTISKYINITEGRIFIIDMYAYLIKLEMKLPINKYDLLNDGNLGYNGKSKIIKEINNICQKEKCTFLLNKKEIGTRISQYNQDIYLYIINNYQESENIIGLTVYKNH